MNIFEYAMQMETDGEKYYRQLAQQTTHDGLQAILTMLADEEVRHYNTIKKMQTKEPHMTETTVLTDAKNIIVEMKEFGESFDFDITQTELYRKARDIEKESWGFYTDKVKEVTEEYQKEIFLRLADEGKIHYFLLEILIELVSRSENWLENAEFYHLDEY